jgi:hypothetical protein
MLPQSTTQAATTSTTYGRKYFCFKPVSEACKKGFLNLSSYTQHRNAKHAAFSQLKHASQYPHIPELKPTTRNTQPESHANDSDEDVATTDSGAQYFIKHSGLNGVSYCSPQPKT